MNQNNNPSLIKDILNPNFQSDPEFHRNIALRLKRDSRTDLCCRIYEDKTNGNWAAHIAPAHFMEWSFLDDLSESPTNQTEPKWMRRDPLGPPLDSNPDPQYFRDSVDRAVKAIEWVTAREIASGKCKGRICEVWRIVEGDYVDEYLGFWYDPLTANAEVNWSISTVERTTIVPSCVQGMFQSSSEVMAMGGLGDFLNVDPANLYLYEVFEESDPLSIRTASDRFLYHRPWAQVRTEDPRDELKGIDIVNDQEAFSSWFSKWPFALMLPFSPLETHPIMYAIEANDGEILKFCLDSMQVYGAYKWYSSHSRSLMQAAITSNSPGCIRELLSHWYSEWDLEGGHEWNDHLCDSQYAIVQGKFDLVSLIHSLDSQYIEQGYYKAFESGDMSQEQLVNAIKAASDIGLHLNIAKSNLWLLNVPVDRRSVILKMLVESGSNINEEGYDGTAVEEAIGRDNLDEVLMLIELGADKNLAIEEAVKEDRHEILAALLELP